MTHTDVNRDAAYEIPLSPVQLQQLGLLAAIWSQIDHLVSLAIAHLMNVDPMKVETMLGRTMTGQRLELLRKHLDQISSDDIKRSARKFCDNMGSVIERRNHITHGIWGWYVDLETKVGRRASYFHRYPKKPIFADDLSELVARCAIESHRIDEVLCNLMGIHRKPDQIPQYFFSEGDPPEWYPKLL